MLCSTCIWDLLTLFFILAISRPPLSFFPIFLHYFLVFDVFFPKIKKFSKSVYWFLRYSHFKTFFHFGYISAPFEIFPNFLAFFCSFMMFSFLKSKNFQNLSIGSWDIAILKHFFLLPISRPPLRFFPIFFHFFVVFDVFFLKVKFFLKSTARLLRYSHSKKNNIFFFESLYLKNRSSNFKNFFTFGKSRSASITC